MGAMKNANIEGLATKLVSDKSTEPNRLLKGLCEMLGKIQKPKEKMEVKSATLGIRG